MFTKEGSEKTIPTLRLNIPETYWEDGGFYYAYNDEENNFALCINKNVKGFDISENFYDILKNHYKKENPLELSPFIISRGPESEHTNSVSVECFKKAMDGYAKEGEQNIYQRYITCGGKNRSLLKKLQDEKREREDKLYAKRNRFELEFLSGKKEEDTKLKNKKEEDKKDGQKNLSKEANQSKKQRSEESERDPEKWKVMASQMTFHPTIIRLDYNTIYNRKKGGNVAYCISNIKSIANYTEVKEMNEKKFMEDYTKITTVCAQKQERKENEKEPPTTYYVNKMSGLAIEPYEFYAKQIVDYMQRYHGLPLKKLVCDFMRDERDIIYFLGVKAFESDVDPTKEIQEKGTKLNKLLNQTYDKKNDIRKNYKTWTCCLCQLPYQRSRITKLVTFQLIYKLKENLKKRMATTKNTQGKKSIGGKDYFAHIVNNAYNESQSCRICDLCYTLLITEQEIMEIQKTIALCNHIPVPMDEMMSNENKNPEGLVRSPQVIPRVTQWRIMFYFVKFYNFDFSKFPFADGSQVPKNAPPQLKKKGKTNYKLCISLFKQKFFLPIFTQMKDFTEEDEVSLNTSKIFYFFSPVDKASIKQIMRNEEVEIKIVLNDKMNDPIASCTTKCFTYFEDNVRNEPMTSKTVLHFFSDYVPDFKCQVYIGIKCDDEIQSEQLQLFCYGLPDPIYLTSSDYYSHHPLPNDWYELFNPPDQKDKDKSNNYINEDTVQIDIDNLVNAIVDNLEQNKGKKKKGQEKEGNELFNILVQAQKKKGETGKNVNPDDKVYDPYDLLVEIQHKNETIHKIESLPIVMDKSFMEMKQEEKKQRPVTVKLMDKFEEGKRRKEALGEDSMENKKKEGETEKNLIPDDKIYDLYDPYELLVKIQNKNETLNKTESLLIEEEKRRKEALGEDSMENKKKE
ncbi:MAG: hypothetical protein MJ252_19560, partial [archaeon]|nr:hypothetical protein [archaeon]